MTRRAACGESRPLRNAADSGSAGGADDALEIGAFLVLGALAWVIFIDALPIVDCSGDVRSDRELLVSTPACLSQNGYGYKEPHRQTVTLNNKFF